MTGQQISERGAERCDIRLLDDGPGPCMVALDVHDLELALDRAVPVLARNSIASPS
jgi:hypothetical protein